LAERGVLVDQSTVYRWVQRFLPLFDEAARKHREPIGPDWRVDETYARIRFRWHYIYRAIDGDGQIVGVYVSPTRDMVAARTFFEPAISSSGTTLRRVLTDEAATYPPALAAAVPGALHRTGRYRTNGVECDHGFLKERLRPMGGLKSVVSGVIFTRGHALNAQYPPWFLQSRRVRPTAAGIRVDMDPTRGSNLTSRRSVWACRSPFGREALAALTPPHRAHDGLH
jgi:transposase-like protein